MSIVYSSKKSSLKIKHLQQIEGMQSGYKFSSDSNNNNNIDFIKTISMDNGFNYLLNGHKPYAAAANAVRASAEAGALNVTGDSVHKAQQKHDYMIGIGGGSAHTTHKHPISYKNGINFNNAPSNAYNMKLLSAYVQHRPTQPHHHSHHSHHSHHHNHQQHYQEGDNANNAETTLFQQHTPSMPHHLRVQQQQKHRTSMHITQQIQKSLRNYASLSHAYANNSNATHDRGANNNQLHQQQPQPATPADRESPNDLQS